MYVCVYTCTHTDMHMCACMHGELSPVNVGFAEDGFQAVIKLEEGHVLEGRGRCQGSPVPAGDMAHCP